MYKHPNFFPSVFCTGLKPYRDQILLPAVLLGKIIVVAGTIGWRLQTQCSLCTTILHTSFCCSEAAASIPHCWKLQLTAFPFVFILPGKVHQFIRTPLFSCWTLCSSIIQLFEKHSKPYYNVLLLAFKDSCISSSVFAVEWQVLNIITLGILLIVSESVNWYAMCLSFHFLPCCCLWTLLCQSITFILFDWFPISFCSIEVLLDWTMRPNKRASQRKETQYSCFCLEKFFSWSVCNISFLVHGRYRKVL